MNYWPRAFQIHVQFRRGAALPLYVRLLLAAGLLAALGLLVILLAVGLSIAIPTGLILAAVAIYRSAFRGRIERLKVADGARALPEPTRAQAAQLAQADTNYPALEARDDQQGTSGGL